jgi:hypothetical protein
MRANMRSQCRLRAAAASLPLSTAAALARPGGGSSVPNLWLQLISHYPELNHNRVQMPKPQECQLSLPHEYEAPEVRIVTAGSPDRAELGYL